MHLLVSELLRFQNARCNDKNYNCAFVGYCTKRKFRPVVCDISYLEFNGYYLQDVVFLFTKGVTNQLQKALFLYRCACYPAKHSAL